MEQNDTQKVLNEGECANKKLPKSNCFVLNEWFESGCGLTSVPKRRVVTVATAAAVVAGGGARGARAAGSARSA